MIYLLYIYVYIVCFFIFDICTKSNLILNLCDKVFIFIQNSYKVKFLL